MVLILKVMALLLASGLMLSCREQESRRDKLIGSLDSIMTANFKPDVPGASVHIFKDGDLLLQKGYGMANVDQKTPVTPDHVFAIGSITKQFTAQAILLLEEQGKLSVSDPIGKYLTDPPYPDKRITIDNLLSHTSGIVDLFEIPEWFQMLKREVTPQQIVDVFKNKPLLFDPGTNYHYSNGAYALLGMIIEKVSGTSYKEFVQRNIFDPLDMRNTYIPSNNDIIRFMTSGYYQTNEGFTLTDTINYSNLYAAGSIFSCSGDMAKWYSWLTLRYINKDPKVNKVVSQFTLADGSKSNNGYGMLRYDLEGNIAIGNDGGMIGYNAYTLWLPDRNIYVILLTNRIFKGLQGKTEQNANVVTVSKRLATLVLGKKLVADRSFLNIPEDKLDNYTGVYKIDDKVFRIISRKGNQLYSKRSDSGPRKDINPIAENIFLSGDGSRFEFVFNKNGRAVEANWLTPEGKVSVGRLTDLPVPPDKKPVIITNEELNAVCGLYKMLVIYKVKIYRNDSTGIIVESKQQGKSIFYPESPTRFFFDEDNNVIIEFFRNKKGIIDEFKMKTTKLVLTAKKDN